MAQSLYALGKYKEAAEVYLAAAKGASARSQQDFRYNAAASLFKAGKHREAADILRDLSTVEKPDVRARAALGLGTALYRSAELPKEPAPGAVNRYAEALREAAEAFRASAREKPEDDLARRNLGTVLGKLPDARERAKIERLTERYGQMPPHQIAQQMLDAQRRLSREIPAALTNNSPRQITRLEALAAEQESNADLWIPLKGKLLEALAASARTEEQQKQAAALSQLIETTRENMRSAASRLQDLDPAGYPPAAAAEAAVFNLWRVIAPYPLVLQEDLRRQTNAITLNAAPTNAVATQPVSVRSEQQMALDLSRLFLERFTASEPEKPAEADGRPAPPAAPIPPPPTAGTPGTPTNAAPPGISAETRKKILALTEAAISTQDSAVQILTSNDTRPLLDVQRQAHDLLKEIEKLLPKDPNTPQEQQQKEPQDSQQKQGDQQQAQDANQDQTQEPNSDPKQEEPPQQQEPQKPEDDRTPEDVLKMLEKALQREKDHEAEKRRQDRFIPPLARERDW
jgi:hypothetical protein